MALTPEVSFSHTLSEISVNRADPCELVRELISNAYDAGATLIRVYALPDRRGLLFFDNGTGLSHHPDDKQNDILPYVAFFSIGKGTKTRGAGIGYKCQGSKLCFASKRFSVITRTARDKHWFTKTIDNPKDNLKEGYDLTPSQEKHPWKLLHEKLLNDADSKTRAALSTIGEDFFTKQFKTGTLLLIEDFETDEYEQYFSSALPHENYLYQYIRLHTAHGDSRLLRTVQGFSGSAINAVKKTRTDTSDRKLEIWIDKGGKLVSIPQGWMYLDTKDDSFDSSPAKVPQLRSGRFFSRHAATFSHGSDYYSIILAIDGNRRALDKYTGLARRGGSNSGLKLSHTRGPVLSSRGIVVGTYPQFWNLPAVAESDYSILAEGTDHFTLIIDGPFDLVTNRDAPAPSALQVLRDSKFGQKLVKTLDSFRQGSEGEILVELIQRLNRETTRHKEDAYIEANTVLREELPQRDTFTVPNMPILKNRVFYAPLPGEEHFVGALYTLFSHIVNNDNKLRSRWQRPLTFASRGIDSIAVADETKQLTNGNLKAIEYKYYFSPGDEFNHPLNITDTIICWDFEDCAIDTQIKDSYNYLASISNKITTPSEDAVIGFELDRIRHAFSTTEINHSISVLSLKRLLIQSFGARFSSPPPAAKRKKS